MSEGTLIRLATFAAALAAAFDAARLAALDAARLAALDAACEAARLAALDAARPAALDAAFEAARPAAPEAAWPAAFDAAVDATVDAARLAAPEAARFAAPDAAPPATFDAGADVTRPAGFGVALTVMVADDAGLFALDMARAPAGDAGETVAGVPVSVEEEAGLFSTAPGPAGDGDRLADGVAVDAPGALLAAVPLLPGWAFGVSALAGPVALGVMTASVDDDVGVLPMITMGLLVGDGLAAGFTTDAPGALLAAVPLLPDCGVFTVSTLVDPAAGVFVDATSGARTAVVALVVVAVVLPGLALATAAFTGALLGTMGPSVCVVSL